jgi:predicted lipoprotein with Yx(FWY)xxD motif
MFVMSRSRRLFAVGMAMLAALLVVPLALAQGAVTVQVAQNDTLGAILTDGQGVTLYLFTRDAPSQSNCYDQCAAAWPPLLVDEGQEPAAGSGVTGNLGVTERTDGTFQVTYNDMPLYYFVSDAAAGDTNGQGVNDVWFVLNPDAPSVTVSDQALEGDSVTIDRVMAAEPGWLVVHADNDGRPGPVVGHSAVAPGENDNVQVQIDASAATATLYAMLHVDRGTMGTYEFPGDDGPVAVGGQVVTPPFAVTGLAQESAAAPEVLPATGGAPAVWPLVVLAAAVVLLTGGLGLALARRWR